MKSNETTESPKAPGRLRPGLTPETNENQCISMAMDLAKQRLMDGTASNSMILHFLKQGTIREQLERERLEVQMALDRAKKEALESQAKMEQLYVEALNAFQRYGGYENSSEEEQHASPF